jgi:ADP-ribosylglycohydrolase
MQITGHEIRDRVAGAFFGAAIGDALGMPVEFFSRDAIQRKFGWITGFESYQGKNVARPWRVGEWTDDFSQALCVANTLMLHGYLDDMALARRLVTWARTDGRGCGTLTAELMTHVGFLAAPTRIAYEIWRSTPEGANAPNGALMRMFPAALWDFWESRRMLSNVDHACVVTHADPRCRRSCQIMAYTMGMQMGFSEEMDTQKKIENELMFVLTGMNATGDQELMDIVIRQIKGSIEDLKLNTQQGYTYKALAAGLWALCNATNFESGLLPIINEGGDADTNGTVAGALLGIKYGFAGIPRRFVTGLREAYNVAHVANKFIGRMLERIGDRSDEHYEDPDNSGRSGGVAG